MNVRYRVTLTVSERAQLATFYSEARVRTGG